VKTYYSRGYWSNYIDSIIDSIKEDKDTILDAIMYGEFTNAKITLNIDRDGYPNYSIEINKMAQKSPFGEDEDE
jgi:hypothetical protein